VEEHRRLAEETGADACLLVRHGKIASEWYGPRYAPPVNAMSSTKSITGLLAGMLLEEGRIERLEEPVGTYLPEWSEGPRSAVTLRHLLTHTSGLPRLRGQGVGFESDKNTFVRSLQLATAPGTAFAYSNEGVQLLSPILDRAAGEPIQDYARRRLFEPLGMLDTRLRLDQEGHAWTYADMITTPRDLARIGLLMLQRGRWQGKPIVSAEWIEKSTRPSQELEPRCGLLWWVHTEPRGFAALGYLHTDIHVFPSRDLVVVRTQARPAPDGSQPDYRRQALPLLARMVQEE
jgi:CubicO group peptidase (beta-lactamase class C family)